MVSALVVLFAVDQPVAACYWFSVGTEVGEHGAAALVRPVLATSTQPRLARHVLDTAPGLRQRAGHFVLVDDRRNFVLDDRLGFLLAAVTRRQRQTLLDSRSTGGRRTARSHTARALHYRRRFAADRWGLGLDALHQLLLWLLRALQHSVKPKFHYADFAPQTLWRTQIMKVCDTNQVADFHDFCPRIYDLSAGLK